MSLRQRIRFFQQLAVLTRAGVPMRSALERLRERIRGRTLRMLSERISAGDMIGEAFAAAGFSPFECNLVAAGERSAQLEIVFQHLADFWAREERMFQALVRQLYYPLFMLVFALLVNAVIDTVFFSAPVAAVHFALAFAAYAGGGFVLFTLVRTTWRSDAAQRFWLAVPVIGRTLSTACSYRWITAVKIEYGAGVPMPDAVADAWRASGYAARDRLAEEGRAALREGAELSTLVQKWRQLPRDWVDFIETGEISGALETAFANLEDEAARAWDAAQKRMNEWVPKIVYFVMLLIVGAQVLFILLGAYQHLLGPYNEAMKQIGG